MADSVAVHISGLTYNYPDSTQALRQIDLDIHTGEKAAVIGPNGAGKSTLLLHLNGILTGSGTVMIHDTPVKKSTVREIRKRVGFLFQNPEDQLFMPTIYEDIAFGPAQFGLPEEEIKKRVNAILDKIGLNGVGNKPPIRLSYGEQRSAALATALVMEPDIIVMDEPSSNLDPKHRRKLINFIREYAGTMIIATHDLDLAAETCSTAVLLSGGVVVKKGPVKDILTDKKLLEQHDLELPLGSYF